MTHTTTVAAVSLNSRELCVRAGSGQTSLGAPTLVMTPIMLLSFADCPHLMTRCRTFRVMTDCAPGGEHRCATRLRPHPAPHFRALVDEPEAKQRDVNDDLLFALPDLAHLHGTTVSLQCRRSTAHARVPQQ